MRTPARLRLVGHIAAGAPIEAIENQEELDLPGALRFARTGPSFFKVRGNSMIDEQIRDGDYRGLRAP